MEKSLEQIVWKNGNFLNSKENFVKPKPIGAPILALLNEGESVVEYLNRTLSEEEVNAYAHTTISIRSDLLKRNLVYSSIQLYKI